jgi:hypothetical protein
MLSLPTSPETVSSPGWPRRLTTPGHGRDAASTDRDDGDGHEDISVTEALIRPRAFAFSHDRLLADVAGTSSPAGSG